LTAWGGKVEERGSCSCERIGARRALVLAACLAVFATFAAPAAGGGPDPAPPQSRGPAPDPAPQAAPKPAATVVTHVASTSQPQTASSSPPPAQPAATPTRHKAVASAPATHQPVARHVSPAPPPPSVLRRAGRALGALTFSRLAGSVRTVHLPSAASSPDEGLLVLGGAIMLLIVLGEVGFLTASVRLLRRP
jgi:hypothetical protein